jgi:hypothetical protein
MRNWKPVSLLFVLAVVLLLLLEAVASPPLRVLTGSQKLAVTGGGNGLCVKINACGSVYCEKVGGVWKNCSGNTQKTFCVCGDPNDFCDANGDSIACGKWQECTSETCASCTPLGDNCTRTSAGSSGDTRCD